MNMKKLLALSLVSSAFLAACADSDQDIPGMSGVQPEPQPDTEDKKSVTISLEQIGRYESDIFDDGGAEIVSYDKTSQRAFVINAEDATVDVLNLSDPSKPAKLGTIDDTDITAISVGGFNSVSVHSGLVAVAVENDDKQAKGHVAFYNASDLGFITSFEVGALPDLVTFNRSGDTVLVANEGEPNDAYDDDPEGSVSIIDLSVGAVNVGAAQVTTVGFSDFNVGGSRAAELPSDVRIFGNFGHTELSLTTAPDPDADPAVLAVNDASGVSAGDWLTLEASEGDPINYQVASVAGNTITLSDDFDGDTEVQDTLDEDGMGGFVVHLHDGQSSVAQDLEPEYIAVSEDDTKAFVSLQENNAIAVIDLATKTVDRIAALGTKDHSQAGNELDASDKDDGVNIQAWPIKGMYMPDTVASVTINGQNYVLTANEGDAREYDGFVEEIRFEDAPRAASFDSADFDDEEKLGRIATTIGGNVDASGNVKEPFVFGARSFSIWSEEGALVYDSGSDFETITANVLGDDFNNDNGENDGDSRSDAKGPEPETVEVATLGEQHFAFVGLERVGGIMVYEITDPTAPKHLQYINNRDMDYNIADDIDDGADPAGAAGDLGPEGFEFIPEADSPIDAPLLLVGNEVSGTTTIYKVNVTEVE
ncbi:alkaline phosphatase [gamma proteobacterium HTCC5015]|nr:alkaline phosphatase [gamma proteobacterium HTCC5015]